MKLLRSFVVFHFATGCLVRWDVLAQNAWGELELFLWVASNEANFPGKSATKQENSLFYFSAFFLPFCVLDWETRITRIVP